MKVQGNVLNVCNLKDWQKSSWNEVFYLMFIIGRVEVEEEDFFTELSSYDDMHEKRDKVSSAIPIGLTFSNLSLVYLLYKFKIIFYSFQEF